MLYIGFPGTREQVLCGLLADAHAKSPKEFIERALSAYIWYLNMTKVEGCDVCCMKQGNITNKVTVLTDVEQKFVEEYVYDEAYRPAHPMYCAFDANERKALEHIKLMCGAKTVALTVQCAVNYFEWYIGAVLKGGGCLAFCKDDELFVSDMTF